VPKGRKRLIFKQIDPTGSGHMIFLLFFAQNDEQTDVVAEFFVDTHILWYRHRAVRGSLCRYNH
jgi:hypothetical protein